MEQYKTINIEYQGKTFDVSIPTRLYPIVEAKRKVRPFYPNNIASNTCLACGINLARLNNEEVDWVKNTICVACDKKLPYIIVGVTEACSFDECQADFYFANILNIPRIVSTPMLEGIIAHTFDDILVKLMNDKEFFGKMKEKYPSRFEMYNETVKTLDTKYDEIIKTAMHEIITLHGHIPDKLLLNLKRDIFDKLLDDFAYLTVMRIYNDILFDGDYRKLISRRWEEKRVLGHFEYAGVKLFITGRIDKLYRLGNNKFLIRDDKSLRVVRLPQRGESLYSYSKQLGGYAFLLKQMYTPDVEAVGVIWLLRFADVAPAECDVDKFVSILKELCTFIAEGKSPTRRMPHVGLCQPTYCSYWDNCWGLEGK